MKDLSAAERSTLSEVKVVGLKYYPTAFDSLKRAGSIRETAERCLFLVAEEDNPHDPNAVMLHDGKNKLGSVSRDDAQDVRNLLAKWKKERGYDEVVVVTIPWMGPQAMSQLRYDGFIKVQGIYRVNERLARKFADMYYKGN